MQIRLVSHFESIEKEHVLITSVLSKYDVIFHLRKKDFSDLQMLNYLKAIPEELHAKIIMHSHFHFANSFDFHGFHFHKQYDLSNLENDLDAATVNLIKQKTLGFSVHNLNDILALEEIFNYVLVSPVFDSISNRGYNAKIKIKTFQKFLEQQENRVPVIAMGGIKTENIPLAFTAGFDGIALLGHIWNHMLETNNPNKTMAIFEDVVQQVEQLVKTKVLVG